MKRGRRHDGKPRHRRRLRVKTVGVLPSMLTLGNLLCGSAAIFYASRPQNVQVLSEWQPLSVAAILIFTGILLDALDGRVARITRSTSGLGAQLDSMADMVTCGVAPAFLVIQLVQIGTPFFGGAEADTWFDRAVLTVGGVYVACCALRLARFNMEVDSPDEQDHLSFKGLPSPAAAGTVASLVLVHQYLTHGSFPADITTLARATAVAMVLVSLLAALAMVSRMRYVHLLNRYLRDRAPVDYIAMVVFVGFFLLIWPQMALAVGFVAYALSRPTSIAWRKSSRSLAQWWRQWRRRDRGTSRDREGATSRDREGAVRMEGDGEQDRVHGGGGVRQGGGEGHRQPPQRKEQNPPSQRFRN